MDNPKCWALVAIFRVLNAFCIQTAFSADEYWQSIEVAHRLTQIRVGRSLTLHLYFTLLMHTYGHLTWEWTAGLRSYLHPLLFSILFQFLKLVGMDSPAVLRWSPQVFQSVILTIQDYYTYRLAKKAFGQRVASITFICSLFSFFNFYCGVRTFSNCIETALTTAALFYWEQEKSSSSSSSTTTTSPPRFTVTAVLVGLTMAIRPTNIIVWVPVILIFLFKNSFWNQFKILAKFFIPSIFAWLSLSTLIDRYMYSKWIFVPWEFIKFNIFKGGSASYGTHVWHWYLSNGWPTLLLSFLPFFAYGTYLSIKRFRRVDFIATIAWFTLIFSLQPHKEFRFLYPVFPLALVLTSVAMAHILDYPPAKEKKKSSPMLSVLNRYSSIGLTIVFAIQLIVAGYLGAVHQRGLLDAVSFLQSRITAAVHLNGNSALQDHGILVLTPCHHGPGYAHLHHNVSFEHLDCSPPSSPDEQEEQDVFFANPRQFLVSRYTAQYKGNYRPRYLVMYDKMKPQISEFLNDYKYTQIADIFHSHLPLEGRMSERILIFQRNDN